MDYATLCIWCAESQRFKLLIMNASAAVDGPEFYYMLPTGKCVPMQFLVFADARQRDDYNESHIITAKFVSKVSEISLSLNTFD